MEVRKVEAAVPTNFNPDDAETQAVDIVGYSSDGLSDAVPEALSSEPLPSITQAKQLPPVPVFGQQPAGIHETVNPEAGLSNLGSEPASKLDSPAASLNPHATDLTTPSTAPDHHDASKAACDDARKTRRPHAVPNAEDASEPAAHHDPQA